MQIKNTSYKKNMHALMHFIYTVPCHLTNNQRIA